MLIDKLNIQRFRGISGSLSLDLTAPLTVLYAPNGTGKTSICDALEWLLCGSIGRLTSLDKSDVRCRFGDDKLETFAEAIIPHNERLFSIKRVLLDSGSQLYWKDKFSEYKLSTDQDLLRQIVTALPPEGHSSRAKVDWVRSTRFLDSQSLNLLIDSDKDSNDTRKLIFSNLFGVSEYQKAENSLNKILRKLPADRTIEREISKANDRISEYTELVNKCISERDDTYRDHIVNLLQVIAKILGRENLLEKLPGVIDLHKALEVQYLEIKEDVDQKILVSDFFQKNISFYEENRSKKEYLENNIQLKASNLTSISDKYKEVKSNFKKIRSNYDKQSKLVDEISEVLKKLDNEYNLCVYLSKIYLHPVVSLSDGENRLEKISTLISHSVEKLYRLRDRHDLILKCIDNFPLWVEKCDSIKDLKRKIGELNNQILDQKDIQSLSEKISQIKINLENVRASREQTLGELELVLSSGKRYIEEHGDVRECPLCEHKYTDNLELKKRIESNFLKLSVRSQEEASLASEYDSLTKKLQNENSQLIKFKELTEKKSLLNREVDVLEASFVSCEINQDELADQKIVLERLEKLRDINDKEIRYIEEQIEPLNKALNAGNQLDDILIRISSLFIYWSGVVSDLEDGPNVIDSLEKSITVLAKSLNSSLRENKHYREENYLQIEKLADELKKLEEEKKNKDEELLSLKIQCDEYRKKHEEFVRRWKYIGSSDTINKNNIQKVVSELEQQIKALSEVDSFFKKAEEYFKKIKEQDLKEKEINVFEKELNETNKSLQEWLNQKEARSIIEKEIDKIQAEVRKFVSEEIKPLSNTISTLYLRAQGNRFINSISAEPTKDGLLNWIAELDDEGKSFDKMQALSQGQRQDLALSIFLARARNLGGTFFLDEPLAHLDDLNRVALLDTLRIIVSEDTSVRNLRLVLTTASKNLLRHLREKFSLVENKNGDPALRIYKMLGNPKIGLEVEEPELVYSPNRLLLAD